MLDSRDDRVDSETKIAPRFFCETLWESSRFGYLNDLRNIIVANGENKNTQ